MAAIRVGGRSPRGTGRPTTKVVIVSAVPTSRVSSPTVGYLLGLWLNPRATKNGQSCQDRPHVF
jgi:hypothetical protein